MIPLRLLVVAVAAMVAACQHDRLSTDNVQQVAIAGGPPPPPHHPPYYSKGPKAPATKPYPTYKAQDYCGQWPSNLATDWSNLPYENFGCATRHNLAAMVEDPRDLVAPRWTTPRDSERRDQIFDNHRRGQPTGARTDTDAAATSFGP